MPVRIKVYLVFTNFCFVTERTISAKDAEIDGMRNLITAADQSAALSAGQLTELESKLADAGSYITLPCFY